MAAGAVVGWRLVFMKPRYFMSLLVTGLLLGGVALALGAASGSEAAPKPACLTRPAEDIELEMAQIHEAWRAQGAATLPGYEAGSWGPAAADELLAREGRRWRRP